MTLTKPFMTPQVFVPRKVFPTNTALVKLDLFLQLIKAYQNDFGFPNAVNFRVFVLKRFFVFMVFELGNQFF